LTSQKLAAEEGFAESNPRACAVRGCAAILPVPKKDLKTPEKDQPVALDPLSSADG